MPPADRATPREVAVEVCDDCGRVYDFSPILTREQWLMVAPSGYGMLCGYCVGERAAKLPRAMWMETRIVFAGDVPDAALAATGAPISAERLAQLDAWLRTGGHPQPGPRDIALELLDAVATLTAQVAERDASDMMRDAIEGDLLDDVTTLTAQVAALTAERDEAKRGLPTEWRSAENQQLRAENAALRATVARIKDILLLVERHHVEQNERKGRDESRSHTLQWIREALANLPNAHPAPDAGGER